MNTNDIRFLPIDYMDKEITIKEPYLDNILKYLQKNHIEFKYIEAKVIIPALNIKDDDFYNIIKMVKTHRNNKLQKEIKKNYL